MSSPWLYCTTVPVLLDGRSVAGQTAKEIFTRHRLISDWFGEGWSPALSAYTHRHQLRFDALSDHWRVEMLRHFAESPSMRGNLLALIPCSHAAAAFTTRCAETLEPCFILLPYPAADTDPLAGLIQHNDLMSYEV